MIKAYIHAGMPCIFHLVTGYYCPGCGGTRSVIALLHGHFIRSFIYHPIVLYVAGAVIYLLYQKIKPGHPQKDMSRSIVKICIAALIIIAANFIFKNLMLYNGIDLLQ